MNTHQLPLKHLFFTWVLLLSAAQLFANSTPPAAGFSWVQNGLELTFTDTSATSGPTTRHWTFGDGDSSTIFNPVHFYTNPGTYSVCLVVWDSCGLDTMCQSITVGCTGPPTLGSISSTATACLGAIGELHVPATGQLITYEWQEDQGSGFVPIVPNITYSGPTTATLEMNPVPQSIDGYSYRCLVMNPCGDTTISDTILLTVATSPIPTASASDTLICAGDDITLTATGADSYVWAPGIALQDNMAAVTTANLQNTTNFLLTATDSATGCSGTALLLVTVETPPAITITTGSSTLCEGQSSWIAASTTGTIIWPIDSTLSGLSQDSAVVTPSSTTSYLLTSVSAAGCIGTASAAFVVNPLPELELDTDYDTMLCHWDTVNIEALGATSYEWFPAAGLSATTGWLVQASPDTTTTYSIVGTTTGCSDTTSITIESRICIPSAIVDPIVGNGWRAWHASGNSMLTIVHESPAASSETLTLLDLQGRVLWQQQLSGQQLLQVSTAQLRAGMYLLRGSSQAQKIVIQ